MDYIWYTHPTGFSLWKRQNGKERCIYNQMQEPMWQTEEIKNMGTEPEELSNKFIFVLDLIKQYREEGDKKGRDAITHEIQSWLDIADYKEKRVSSEIIQWPEVEVEEPKEIRELLEWASEEYEPKLVTDKVKSDLEDIEENISDE